MRIAQVSPLYETVPPKFYGGTERVVAYLTEALVELGHDVTLFASGDSRTSARLVAVCPTALRLAGRRVEPIACHFLQLQAVMDRSAQFDIIHFHTDLLHYLAAPLFRAPHLTTLHGRLDLPDLAPLYARYRHMPVVSISQAQRKPLPLARWIGTVHHGLPRDLYARGGGEGGYLAFLGRVSPEKRVDRAIEIARRTGRHLKIAAKVDAADRDYFEDEIRPLLDAPGIDFVGEIGEREKQAFLGEASALLFPIDWPEPFGLVVIEALACGTPVIAFPHGSVPELIEHGRTGFVVASVDAAVDAVGRLSEISRATCRSIFERRFSMERMARDYVKLYHRLEVPQRHRRGVDRAALEAELPAAAAAGTDA
jgi:glycosyltransferase involved in cell wall biosynthesis